MTETNAKTEYFKIESYWEIFRFCCPDKINTFQTRHLLVKLMIHTPLVRSLKETLEHKLKLAAIYFTA